MRITNKLAALGLMVVAWAMASSAMAVTPANTRLTAQAKLTYSGNAAGITSSVSVTVQLVPSAVTIASTFSAPNTSVNKAEHDTYAATYTVQSNANGPDTYAIATSYTNVNTVTGSASPTVSVASITLGATAASAAALVGATSISVPSDGVADSNVNGIAANDNVIINGSAYQVASVTDSASGTSTITLTSALTAPVAVGDGIYEYKAFTNNIIDVGVQGGATNALDLQTTVTSNTLNSAQYTSNVTITIVAITMDKYVRDVTNPCSSGCTGPATYQTNTYYASGVQAKPGDTLEYLLVVTTTAAGISTAAITDTLPNYTSYVAGSTKLNNIAVNDAASSPIFPLDSANGGLTLDDNLSRTAGTEGSGTIGTNKTVYVTYQVKVAP